MTEPVDIVRRFYEEIWNQGNLAVIPDICHREMAFRGSLGDTKHGHEGFADYVRHVRGALGDYRCHIEETVVERNRVFARMLFVGIHQGEFLGYAPTWKILKWAGAALFTIEGDRITELWVLGDLHGLINQLSAEQAGNTTMDLPPDVRNAVHANRKIDAIKLLRTQRNLGLKEAKEIIDAYVRENRHLIGNSRTGRESGIGTILILIILGGIVYAAYRALS